MVILLRYGVLLFLHRVERDVTADSIWFHWLNMIDDVFSNTKKIANKQLWSNMEWTHYTPSV